MKTKELFISTSIFLVVGIGCFLSVQYSILNNKKPYYQPRSEKNNYAQGWQGAAEYYKSIRANQITGRIDYSDVLRAEQEVKAFAMKKTADLNLQWKEMGPSNIGGRTRAILVDKNNSNRVYAGAVSGGLWYSDNAGGTWKQHDDLMRTLVISCIEQAPNGDIYIGTGCSFESPDGIGGSGFIGKGIFKSTDGGQNFIQLASTLPLDTNSNTAEWIVVNAIATDPNDSEKIYAAMNRGLRLSKDGGKSWTNPLTKTKRGEDVEVASDGTVAVAIFGNLYISSNGESDYINVSGSGNGQLPTANGNSWERRLEVEFAPSDDNYIYAINITNKVLKGIYRSTDKGNTWSLVEGPITKYFEPFLSGDPPNGQGFYDCALTVYPNDPNKILLGGVELWRWDGNLTQVATTFGSFQSRYYVHADKHTFEFDPNNSDILYIGNDGGVFKSENANDKNIEFRAVNKGYNVTQFYSVAFSKYDEVLGGTQDNGTIWLDRISMNVYNGDSTEGFIARKGDGFDCDVSTITDAAFATIYESNYARSDNIDFDPQASDEEFAKFTEKLCNESSDDITGPFYTRGRLWETFNDPSSQDSITFSADTMEQFIENGNGTKKSFTDTLNPGQSTANIVQGSVSVRAGLMKLTDIGNGILSGDGSGTVDYTTRTITVEWSTAPNVNLAIYADFAVEYPTGTVLNLKSKTGDIPVTYTLPSYLGPGESVKVQDPVQSLYVAYFRCKNDASLDGIYITRDALNFDKEPDWWKLKNSNFEPTCMEFSKDGNHLFVGTYGAVQRFSGLSNVYDSTSAANAAPVRIYSTGQVVTGVAIDQSNPENVVITLGNYKNNVYVRLSTNAVSAKNATEASFQNIQGDLPKMPVYDAIIDVRDPSKLIIGTEYGVYATSDMYASTVSWSDENSSMDPVPVFEIRQQTFSWNKASNHEVIYIGTHGRGIWKTETLVGIEDYPSIDAIKSKKDFYSGLAVYPNPMDGNGYIEFYMTNPKNVQMNVFDLQGKLVKKIQLQNLHRGDNKVNINSNDLPTGTYFIHLQAEDAYGISKFIVLR